METNQAEENLKVIRTIMERAALYRRRLGPIMLVPGVVGTALGLGGYFGGMEEPFTFVCSWLGAAVFTMLACLLVSRFQAKGTGETVFSPSARRVLSALVPALTAGLLITLPWLNWLKGMGPGTRMGLLPVMILVWMAFYGAALNGAGQYSSRGVRVIGWVFILTSSTVMYYLLNFAFNEGLQFSLGPAVPAHDVARVFLDLNLLMAITFGGYHLIAAAYLFVTEKRGSST